MATLEQVAKSLRDLSQRNVRSGINKAYKTGNLFRKIGSENPVGRMIRETKTSAEIVLDYGPRGALYGRYVHDGTRKMKARPFALQAYDDPNFQRILDKYIETTFVDSAIKELTIELDKF
jgi:HK97 gp10 family phage protein